MTERLLWLLVALLYGGLLILMAKPELVAPLRTLLADWGWYPMILEGV